MLSLISLLPFRMQWHGYPFSDMAAESVLLMSAATARRSSRLNAAADQASEGRELWGW